MDVVFSICVLGDKIRSTFRSVELEDEQMDTLLEFAIGDYSQYVQNFLIDSQWTQLWGLNMDTQSLSRAFITKNFSLEERYSYAYSKIVGLQAGGDWVLQKDFIQLEPDQQIYEIPQVEKLMNYFGLVPRHKIICYSTLLVLEHLEELV